MYQAVIFDFDYTLGDSTGGIELSINYALETMGYSCQSTDEIKKTIGLSLKDTFERLTLCKDAEAASRFSALFHQKADEVMVDIIVGAEDVKVEKPSPEGLLFAIEHLNMDKENVIHVGDSVVDAQTAQRAEVDFVGVLTGVTDRKDFGRFQHVYIGRNLTEFYRNIFIE